MDPFIRISWKIYLFIYLVALGFKLRASSLLGRPSTTRATPSALVGKSFRNTESWECQKSLESSMTTFNLVGCCVPQDSFSSFSSTMVQTQGFMLARHLRPAALFVWYFFFFFEIGSVCPGWLGSQSSYFKLSSVTGMTGAHHHTPEMVSCELFYLGWAKTAILPISSSCIAWDDRCMPPPTIS
jgi:hypothetical protein